MKSHIHLLLASGILAFLLGSTTAPATTVYTDYSDFISVLNNYNSESFYDVTKYTKLSSSLSFTAGEDTYTISGSGGLYSGYAYTSGSFLSTWTSNTSLSFNLTSGPLTALGGYFFLTNVADAAVSGTITATLNDGTSRTISISSTSPTFLGFTSTSGISSLTLSTNTSVGFVSIDNLYTGLLSTQTSFQVSGAASWNSPGSWSGGVPVSASDVRIGTANGAQNAQITNLAAVAQAVTFSGSGGQKTITLAGNSSLTVGNGTGDISTSISDSNKSVIAVTGTASITARRVSINQLQVGVNTTGALTIGTGQTWTVSDSVTVGTGTGIAASLSLASSLSTPTLTLGNASTGETSLTLESGSVLAANTIRRQGTSSSAATIIWNDGRIQGFNSLTPTLQGTNSSPTGLLTIQLAGTGTHTLYVASGATMAVTNTTITDKSGEAGTLVKDGEGTLNLSSTNSFTGGTTIKGGTLALLTSTSLGSGAINIQKGTLDIGSPARTISTSGLVTLGSTSGEGSLINGGISSSAGFDVWQGTASASLKGSGTLTKYGTGTVSLSGSNSYSGGTVLKAGILSLDGAGALGTSGSISFEGGTLRYSAQNSSDYSARFSSASGQAYKFDTNGQDVTASANLTSSGGSLSKTGLGTLSLSGNNTFSGSTTISEGILALDSANALSGTSSVAFKGGTLRYSANNQSDISAKISSAANQAISIDTHSANVTYASSFGSSGSSLVKTGDGFLALTAANTYTAGTTISQGTLKANNSSGSATGSGSVTVSSGASLIGTGSISGPVTVQGTISGGDGVGKLTTGSEIWAGGGSYLLEINNANGGAGLASGWDLISINGALDITSSGANPFTISLTSISSGLPGLAANFSEGQNYSWTILTTSNGITGLTGNSVHLDTSAFLNSHSDAFSLVLANGNRDLVLRYNAAPTTPAQLAISSPVTVQRVVAGQETTASYVLTDTSGANQGYALQGVNLSSITDIIAGDNPHPTILANAANPVVGTVSTAGYQGGDVIHATLIASSSVGSTDSVSKTVDVHVLNNRTLSLDNGGDLGNLGRVIVGSEIGTITLSTHETDDIATRITANSGTFGGQFVVTAADSLLFDGPEDSLTLHIKVSDAATLGYGQKTQYLSSLSPNSDGQHFLVAENIPGSDLSNVSSITATASFLTNRDISGFTIDLGRSMVNSVPTWLVGDAVVSLSSGWQGDNEATRVTLGRGTVSSDGAYVNVNSPYTFNGSYQSASVDFHYSGAVDSSTAGRQSLSVNIASLLENAEDPSLAGVVLDNDVTISASKSFVLDRQLSGDTHVIVGALTGKTVNTITNYIYSYGSDDSYTRITVNGVLMNGMNDVADVVSTGGISSSLSTGEIMLGSRSFSEGNGIVGEGLAGETVTSFSWDYGVKFYQAAEATVTTDIGGQTGTLAANASPSSSALDDGDTISISNAGKNDAGTGERASLEITSRITGNDGFTLTGLAALLAAGDSTTGTVNFDSTGRLNGTHSALLTLGLRNDSSLVGSQTNDLGVFSVLLKHVVTGNSGLGGSAVVASGTTLRSAGINGSFSNSQFNQKTSAALLDSQLLSANTQVQVAFSSISTATGTNSENLASDLVSLDGLDHIQFVLQISYDEDTLISKFGTEDVAVLTWLDPDDHTWKNAIIGNSLYGEAGLALGYDNAYGQRYRLSYDSYLALIGGTPRLNDYGYDPDANVMWAVLDHNSEFGGSGDSNLPEAVPEPSTWALIAIGCAFLLLRLRPRHTAAR